MVAMDNRQQPDAWVPTLPDDFDEFSEARPARLDHLPSPDDVDKSPLFWRVLGVASVLALCVFWIWAFANRGSIAHPDEFGDAAWRASAEAGCVVRQDAIAALPNPVSVDTPEERGQLVATATAELEAMIEGLHQLGLPDDPQGADTVPRWLGDYELYLQDRRNWTEILLTGQDPPFLISGNADGVRVTDLLETFAEVNQMASCAPSPDA